MQARGGLERYAFIRELGSGNFGVARLMRDTMNGELVAIKFIERGDRVGILAASKSLNVPTVGVATQHCPGGQERCKGDPESQNAQPPQYSELQGGRAKGAMRL
jgi:hypothetical protein